HFVRAPFGWIIFSSGAGGRAEHTAQLCRRGPETHDRLRDRGDGNDRPFACERPTVRNAGERHNGDRMGRRPGYVSDPTKATLTRVPARGGASSAADERDCGND